MTEVREMGRVGEPAPLNEVVVRHGAGLVHVGDASLSIDDAMILVQMILDAIACERLESERLVPRRSAR